MTSAATTDPIAAPAPSRAAAIRIVPYTEAEAAEVSAFNERMRAGRAPTDFVLPDQPNRAPAPDAPITWTKYLAVEDGGTVRGGFFLMEQPAWIDGRETRVANYQAPVSEGILDNRYGMVGMHMLRYVQRRWPNAFVVGMGAMDRPLPRLLAAAGWQLSAVPFLFRIVRSRRVLRELRPLQERPPLRIAATIAAATGAGWLAAHALHARGLVAGGRSLRAAAATSWDDWADRLWARVRGEYSFAVVRDRRTLEYLYPPDDARHLLFRFEAGGSPVGWAVCARTTMRDHAYFGNLTVATVLDAVSLPEFATAVAAAATRILAESADLIITNQSHRLWVDAFRRAGFASTRSNYLLAVSKPLAAAIDTARIHISRGDGDGRIHLL